MSQGVVISNVEPVQTPSLRVFIGGKPRNVYPGRDLRDGHRVYFVEAGDSGKVKIGTSMCVKNRLSQLQGASPERMSLLLSIEGGQRVESEIHKLYKAERIRREWFSKSGALAQFLDTSIWAFLQIDSAIRFAQGKN